MTMTEILRSSQQAKDIKLPQIHSGQVQLVTRNDGISSERKRRRAKKANFHRPERPSPRAPQDNSNSMRVSYSKPTADVDAKTTNTEQMHWKKKLHRRQSKRHMAEENDSVNVSITISG